MPDHIRPATLLVSLAAALLCTAPVWNGWYADHDSMRPFVHGRQIAEQWRLLHLIPVWSTTSHLAHGSPQPLLYGKTFSYLTGLFDLLGASDAFGVGAALVVTMLAGIACMARAVRIVLAEPRPLIETGCGILAVSCNYATTNWLVRGDYAEFTAQMILPLVVGWCVLLMRDGRWRLGIGPLLALLVLTHAGIAFFALLPLLLAVLVAATRGAAVRSWIAPGLASVALFAALLAPFVLPAIPMLRYAQTDMLRAVGTPVTNHLALSRLFLPRPWYWTLPHGHNRQPLLSVQLDPALLVAALAAAAALARGRLARSKDDVPTAIFLFAVAVACLALQTRAAAPLFALVPVADYIQFSWRLLTFIGVALILLAAMLLRPLPRPVATALVIALVLSTLPNKFWPLEHGAWRYDPGSIARMDARYEDPVEYGPRIRGETGWQAVATVERVARQPGRCAAAWREDMRREHARAHLDVSCPSPGPTALPVFLPPGLRLQVDGVPLAATLAPGDPRAVVTLPAGATAVTVLFPTWWSVVASLLRSSPG